MKDVLPQFIQPDHASPHGTRKGSAMEATAGSTCPPPMSSIARRGEWSMGKVYDIYLMFMEAGDRYLGRILAVFNSCTSNFSAIPPHFIVGMENAAVRDAMHQCFDSFFGNGSLIEQQPNLEGMLLRCLASMVHHSETLIGVIDRNPGHCFQNIPILNDTTLLKTLKELVWTKESEKIPQATGIPPHVKQFEKLDAIIKLQLEDCEQTKKFQEELLLAVQNKIEELSMQSGTITVNAAQGLFNDFEHKMKGMMNHLLDEKLKDLMPSSRQQNGVSSSTPLRNGAG